MRECVGGGVGIVLVYRRIVGEALASVLYDKGNEVFIAVFIYWWVRVRGSGVGMV